MAPTLRGLDGRFIAFLFLTYCEELRVFSNKGEMIQFHRATELFIYFRNTGQWTISGAEW
jgi:hypothetical protein